MPSLGLIHPRMLVGLWGFYPSTCTIQVATETQDSVGQPIPAWANLAGHVAIPCRIAPIERASGWEVKASTQTYTVATWKVALRSYYPAIITKMRAVAGGVNYNILAVEHDDQETMTVLQVDVVT